MPQPDALGRPLRNLRISVTDRCNLRCAYCMPEQDYVWLPREDILTFEEVSKVVDSFAELGVDRVRLTGGEPLLRHDVVELVSMLAAKPALRDLSMTTNGVLLARHAAALARAGLHRVTVSLDTLRPERFRELTRRDDLEGARQGLEAACEAGFRSVKVNAVVMRGVNDDEVVDLLQFGRELGAEVRFIEYMDVGGATRWSMTDVVTRAQILERVSEHYGSVVPLEEGGSAPADRYRLPDGTVFGLIASTTSPFCGSCDRSRLTADGMWYTCLYATQGTDLRGPLREGEELRELLARTWSARTDRGAEERLGLDDRRPTRPADPHLEMHTRGG